MLASLFLALATAGLAFAAPSVSPNKRFLDCMNPVPGLSVEDCNYLSQIGLARPGKNARTPANSIWIGEEGPFRFFFKNKANVPQTLVLWRFYSKEGDGKFNAPMLKIAENPAAEITYSLAADGQEGSQVTVSVGPGISAAYSWVNNDIHFVDPGIIGNTWGEFTTGNGGPGSGCTNVSQLPKMTGRPLTIHTPTCTADTWRCSYVCTNGQDQCGELGTYKAIGCTDRENPGSGIGTNGVTDADEGGCFGFDERGDIEVLLG